MIIRKILIAAAVLMVLFTTAFATVEEFRISVLNFTLDVKEKYSTLVFEEKRHNTAHSGKEQEVISEKTRWFGDGRIIVNFDLTGFEALESYSDDYGAVVYLIAEELDQTILIQSTKIVDGLVSQVDTEDADSIADISIGDYSGYIVTKENRNHIVLLDSQNSVMLEVATAGMGKEQSIALAENVLYVSK